MKKCILKSLKKFTGKHQRQSLFFNKVAGLRQFLQGFFITDRYLAYSEIL